MPVRSERAAFDWHCFHAFYGGSLDRLLSDCVQPEVRRAMAGGMLQRWFFIRYWNGGPHVRLRLFATEDCVERMAKRIEEFIAECPRIQITPRRYMETVRAMTALSTDLSAKAGGSIAFYEESEPFRTNSCLERRPYQFDDQRYGGMMARDIAEEHFWRSSEIALLVIANVDEQLRLSTALQFAAASISSVLPDNRRSLMLAERASLIYQKLCGPSTTLEQCGFNPLDDTLLHEMTALLKSWQQYAVKPDMDMPRIACAWANEIRRVCDELQIEGIPQSSGLSVNQLMLEYLHLMWNRVGITLSEEWYIYSLIRASLARQQSQIV